MTAEASSEKTGKPRGSRRITGVIVAAILGIALVVTFVASITPWPSALLIRSIFERGAADLVVEMERHAPAEPVGERLAVPYGKGSDAATTLDVFTNAAGGEALPAVVWIHGGAWISGSSADVAPYLRILADAGYTAVGLNYTLGPEGTYPTAVHQLNDALAYLDEHAAELGIDPDQLVLAGDSAGAQLASQLAAIATNDRYAHLMGITPAIDASQLRGVLLNCGVYDLSAMAELQGLVAWGFQVSLWAYTGTKNWSASSEGATMSTIDFVTDDFPPTYISGGNGDGLTWLQSLPMASALRAEGVEVTELFWPAGHEPALPHEYQFALDSPEAQEALDATLDWLSTVVSMD